MDDWELRETVIDTCDVYDLVEVLDLTVEDLIDRFDILQYEDYRKIIFNKIIRD
jgi:hypothetical protein